MTATDSRIILARDVLAAWSSGDLDAPKPFFHADAVLQDIVGGTHVGWPAMRQFFDAALTAFPDLAMAPDQYWTNDDGVAVSWVLTASVTEAGVVRLRSRDVGPEHIGKQWRSLGMSWFKIVDGKIAREVDYHDSGALARSVR